jgi:AcrR family transcriptional regulator
MSTDASKASLQAVRGGLRQSGDPRVAKTRERIFAAVQGLTTSNSEISVSAIVAEAGVSRATFYTHFADLEELALALQESVFGAIADVARSDERDGDSTAAMLASQRQLVRHYAEHRVLYAAVFSLPVSRGVQGRVAQLMARDIRSHIVDHGELPAHLDADLSALYIANAATGLIVAWVLGEVDVHVDADGIAEHLLELMPRWMHRGTAPHDGDAAMRTLERNQP